MLYDFIYKIFPLVKRELSYWQNYIERAPDQELSKQGVLSINTKKFHSIGGSFFSLYNQDYIVILTRIIVAYQTISDYLDNLCDRTGVYSKKAFEMLHYSMFHALSTKGISCDYYRYFPRVDDGGYLFELVQTCRKNIDKLPSFRYVKDDIDYYVALYRDLQVFKHDTKKGEERLIKWFKEYEDLYPEITWWEFSCASGSTLLVFALLALATKKEFDFDESEKEKIINAYFPWICGFHIMLDYYIDQGEDKEEGDMNLVSFYGSKAILEDRLLYFSKRSLKEAKKLPQKDFHLAVVKGLMAMYLSDPKVKEQGFERTAWKILRKGGTEAILMYYLCKILRAKKTL